MGKYVAVNIPKDLADKIDELVGTFGYTSRAEFTKEALRRLILECRKTEQTESILQEVLPFEL